MSENERALEEWLREEAEEAARLASPGEPSEAPVAEVELELDEVLATEEPADPLVIKEEPEPIVGEVQACVDDGETQARADEAEAPLTEEASLDALFAQLPRRWQAVVRAFLEAMAHDGLAAEPSSSGPNK